MVSVEFMHLTVGNILLMKQNEKGGCVFFKYRQNITVKSRFLHTLPRKNQLLQFLTLTA